MFEFIFEFMFDPRFEFMFEFIFPVFVFVFIIGDGLGVDIEDELLDIMEFEFALRAFIFEFKLPSAPPQPSIAAEIIRLKPMTTIFLIFILSSQVFVSN